MKFRKRLIAREAALVECKEAKKELCRAENRKEISIV
jgi:hypothetical protein